MNTIIAETNQIFYKGKTHKEKDEVAMTEERNVAKYEGKAFLHHSPIEQEEIVRKQHPLSVEYCGLMLRSAIN